jgi:membrane protein
MGFPWRATRAANGRGDDSAARPEIWESEDCISIRQLAEGCVPVKELVNRVWKEVDADNVPGLAAQTSYYFVLAFFPFLIFLSAVVGSLPFTGLWDEALTWITLNFPRESQQLILDTISGLTHNRGAFLSIGLLGTAWAASAGFMNLMCSLNIAYEAKETRSFCRRLGLAFIMLVVLTFLSLGCFGLLTVGDLLGARLANHGIGLLLIVLWVAARWALCLLLLVLALALLDHALPNRRRPWRSFTAGSLFFMLAWIPSTLGFNLYVQHFASYGRTYGALGTFVVLMIWTYITSLIALIGAEINRELHKMRAEANSSQSSIDGSNRRRLSVTGDEALPALRRRGDDPLLSLRGVYGCLQAQRGKAKCK